MYEDNDQFFSSSPGKQQVTSLVPRLMQIVGSMHHIDELFQWLAQAFVHYFNIQVLVFWTNHVAQSGQLAVQLRALARQDASLPEQILVNDQMLHLMQRLMNERMAYNVQPVEALFSHYQTILLKRYGLHYWATCFTSRNALLPPRTDIFAQGEPPAFLAITTLCLFKQPPQPNLMPICSLTLDKAMELAETHHLLLTAPKSSDPLLSSYLPPTLPLPLTPSPFPSQEPTFAAKNQPLSLGQLIPQRKQDADVLVSSNPFATSSVIPDKKARRLHAAIDGQMSIAELSASTGLSNQELRDALQLLWDQQRIEVREPGGKLVNLTLFL
ncbi:MAG TPA: hypothetical protein VKV19_00370 [Ktedonobacteraceae bacterium]|jgi:hypothetical protein|nr:hypothetical protein [Ktedonobacteraceae bacterium]